MYMYEEVYDNGFSNFPKFDLITGENNIFYNDTDIETNLT